MATEREMYKQHLENGLNSTKYNKGKECEGVCYRDVVAQTKIDDRDIRIIYCNGCDRYFKLG